MQSLKNMAINSKTQKIALLGILGAQALVLSFFEMLLPALPFLPPGVKPGFSNIITMFCASTMGFSGAIIITVLKSGFAFLTRGATAFFMSFSGGFLSTVVMCLLLRAKKQPFGLMGIAVISAIFHNLGQLIVSLIISGTPAMLYYVPVLLIFAVLTGMVTGAVLKAVMPLLIKQSKFFDRRNL